MSRANPIERPGSRGTADVFDLVLKELMRLRKGAGLTHARVRDMAPTIQRLKAVDDELQRRTEVNRSVAAYNVIKCAVTREVIDPTFRTALIRTFNLDGCGGSLSSRLSSLGTGLLSVSSKNAVMGRTNDAYDELAAVLVSAERSPCRDGGVISPTEIIERALSHVAGQNVTIALPLQPLVKEILSGLSRASNAEIEDAYGSALLQLLPNLEPYLDSTEIPPEQVYSAIVRIDEWLEARRPINRFSRKARLHLFDPRVRAQADYLAVDQWSAGLTRPPRRALMPISWTLIAVGGSLRRVKLGLFHRYLDRRPRLSRWVQGSVLLRLAKKIDANRKVRRSYWRHRTAYISELSRAMAGFEQENSWSELFGPAQDIGSRRP